MTLSLKRRGGRGSRPPGSLRSLPRKIVEVTLSLSIRIFRNRRFPAAGHFLPLYPTRFLHFSYTFHTLSLHFSVTGPARAPGFFLITLHFSYTFPTLFRNWHAQQDFLGLYRFPRCVSLRNSSSGKASILNFPRRASRAGLLHFPMVFASFFGTKYP